MAAVARHFGIDRRNHWESRVIESAQLMTYGTDYEVVVRGIGWTKNVYVVRATGAVEEEE